MANFLRNLDLDFLYETEEMTGKFMGLVAEEGKAIVGYYGSPYINKHLGNAQIILRTIFKDEADRFEVSGQDTHSAGRCVWETRLSGMNLQRKDADILERRCLVTRREDGGGMAVVNIVNADVLPSFAEDEFITLQMIAFPVSIDYFPDEDAYAEAQPEGETGKRWLLGDGTVFPSGLLHNRNPESDEFEQDDDLDDLVAIRGTVKNLYAGILEFRGEKYDGYIRCIIDTEFGPLELVHTAEQVKEEQRASIKQGSVVSGVVVLSGDAAIFEYEEGFVADESHDLAALRYTFIGGDPERLRSILAQDAEYLAEFSGKLYKGADEIIERLKSVQEDGEQYFAHMATISSVDDGDEELPYGVGKRCIVLAAGEETKYESIAFIDVNEEGKITRLVTSTNARYHFAIDEKPRTDSPLEGIKRPESVTEPILMRARFHGIIGDEIDDKDILEHISSYQMYQDNARNMLDALPDVLESADNELLANIFGYLFAKAVEAEYSDKHNSEPPRNRLTVSYAPSDAREGKIVSLLEEDKQKKIEKAMKLGKQFCKDFCSYRSVEEDTDDEFEDDLVKALILVQQLGCMYSERCLGE